VTSLISAKNADYLSLLDLMHTAWKYQSVRQNLWMFSNILFIIPPMCQPHQNGIVRYLYQSIPHTTSALRIAKLINRDKPSTVLVYATSLCQLTRLREKKYLLHDPDLLIIVAEWTSDREWFRTLNTWKKSRVEQLYGASELPAIANRQPNGTYRLLDGVTFDGVDFKKNGRHTHSNDGITLEQDGSIRLHCIRNQYDYKLLDCGLALMDQSDLMSFQVSSSEASTTVAYCGNVNSRVIETHFRKIGVKVKAVRGDAAFQTVHSDYSSKVAAVIRH
jgi:hypothetical protein